MKKYLLLVPLAMLAGSTAAQTGRLAHLSHGGSAATLAAAERADNFGLPTHEYRYLKVTRLNDSLMMVDGQQRHYGSKGPWQPMQERQQYWSKRMPQQGRQLLDYLHRMYPGAQVVGFDTTAVDQPPRKKSVFGPSLPTAPTPGAGLALLLAGAGWLLAGRRRPVLA